MIDTYIYLKRPYTKHEIEEQISLLTKDEFKDFFKAPIDRTTGEIMGIILDIKIHMGSFLRWLYAHDLILTMKQMLDVVEFPDHYMHGYIIFLEWRKGIR